MVSSDFIHYIRARVERDLGGTAVYFTGDLGAAEIVGDTCVGGAGPHADDGTNEFDTRDDLGFARTEQIGDLVGDAVVQALAAGEPLAVADVDVARARLPCRRHQPRLLGRRQHRRARRRHGSLRSRELSARDRLLRAGRAVPAPARGRLRRAAGRDDHRAGRAVSRAVLRYRRAPPHRLPGCPHRPAVRAIDPRRHARAVSAFCSVCRPTSSATSFPGYDFYDPPVIFEEAEDPCQGQQFDPEIPRRTVPSHYHESLAVGLDMAATSTCYALRLLGREDDLAANAACQRVLGTG